MDEEAVAGCTARAAVILVLPSWQEVPAVHVQREVRNSQPPTALHLDRVRLNNAGLHTHVSLTSGWQQRDSFRRCWSLLRRSAPSSSLIGRRVGQAPTAAAITTGSGQPSRCVSLEELSRARDIDRRPESHDEIVLNPTAATAFERVASTPALHSWSPQASSLADLPPRT